MGRTRIRLIEILRRAHLTRETRNEALALLYLEQISRLFKNSEETKVLVYFPEKEEVYVILVKLAREQKFKVGRPFLGRIRRMIFARRIR